MAEYGFHTLPDLGGAGLRLVLIGINPSTYAVARGHYFARRTNRFWPAFSRSRLSAEARHGLGVEMLLPEHDVELPRFGIGFTDLVKIPSGMSTALSAEDYRTWTPQLVQRLQQWRPLAVCFHGLTAWRPFVRWGLDTTMDYRKCELGAQPVELDGMRIFVVPNPSAANAHFTPEEQTRWYDRLADFLTN